MKSLPTMFTNLCSVSTIAVLLMGSNDIVLACKDTFNIVISLTSDHFAKYMDLSFLFLLIMERARDAISLDYPS